MLRPQPGQRIPCSLGVEEGSVIEVDGCPHKVRSVIGLLLETKRLRYGVFGKVLCPVEQVTKLPHVEEVEYWRVVGLSTEGHVELRKFDNPNVRRMFYKKDIPATTTKQLKAALNMEDHDTFCDIIKMKGKEVMVGVIAKPSHSKVVPGSMGLPPEMISRIFSYLPWFDKTSARQVCSLWAEILPVTEIIVPELLRFPAPFDRDGSYILLKKKEYPQQLATKRKIPVVDLSSFAEANILKKVTNVEFGSLPSTENFGLMMENCQDLTAVKISTNFGVSKEFSGPHDLRQLLLSNEPNVQDITLSDMYFGTIKNTKYMIEEVIWITSNLQHLTQISLEVRHPQKREKEWDLTSIVASFVAHPTLRQVIFKIRCSHWQWNNTVVCERVIIIKNNLDKIEGVLNVVPSWQYRSGWETLTMQLKKA